VVRNAAGIGARRGAGAYAGASTGAVYSDVAGLVANEQAWLRKRKFKPVVLCRRLPNNVLKGTRRGASSCFAGIPAARPLARALQRQAKLGVSCWVKVPVG
jgi:hypothetical protein